MAGACSGSLLCMRILLPLLQTPTAEKPHASVLQLVRGCAVERDAGDVYREALEALLRHMQASRLGAASLHVRGQPLQARSPLSRARLVYVLLRALR